MNSSPLFITATDTDAGKTHIGCALIYALTKTGRKVAAFKPVSAGCDLVDGVLINEDAKRLTLQANAEQSISDVNPIAFEPPIAPHIAAKQVNQQLTAEQIVGLYQSVAALNADINLIEGAGGWRLPLNEHEFLSDVAKALSARIVVVINMKLGCINHALLTIEAIKADGLEIVGWIANCQQAMDSQQDNLDTLKTLVDSPLLGIVDYQPDIKKAASALTLEPLLQLY